MGCPLSLQINEQTQAVTPWHRLDRDGLTGSKHSITPTLLPLLSEHSGGSRPRRLARPKLCEPWALLCPWHGGLLAPATPVPCCCMSFWSLPKFTSPRFAGPTRIWTHISLSVFHCHPKQWEAGIVNKEWSTRSLASPNCWAFELLDINAFGVVSSCSITWTGWLPSFLHQRVPKTIGFFRKATWCSGICKPSGISKKGTLSQPGNWWTPSKTGNCWTCQVNLSYAQDHAVGQDGITKRSCTRLWQNTSKNGLCIMLNQQYGTQTGHQKLFWIF